MNAERIARLRGGASALGTWLSIGSPVIAELAAESGFDWLLFDLEHGCGSEASLFSNLQAIKGTGAAGVVRVGAPHPDQILRCLDWGADGIMVPHISSAAEAKACVEAVRYPPLGHRGMSRTIRAYNYGLNPPSAQQSIAVPLLIAQIETLDAVERVDEIAAVEGVDVLFVGPGDLSFDISVRKGPGVPTDEECFRKVVAAAKAAGKPAGILVRNQKEMGRFRALGYSHIAVDSDLTILRSAYLELGRSWKMIHSEAN